jgi:hypothetical protein
LLTVFAGGSHCLWCPKSRWSPPLGTPITLKIGKIWLEARKLQSRRGGGGVFFCRKFSMKQLIAYFWTPQKALKYYCVAVTRWFVKDGDFRALLNCSIWKKNGKVHMKLLNLNRRMRKFCIDEVGGVKMKKNEKYLFCNLKKRFFFYCSFLVAPWLCISKMICKAWEGAFIIF